MALVCDVAHMYLRIGIASKNQPYHRFLWRGLNQNQVPDHYEFKRLVFGVNSYLFQAQFVTQTHAKKIRNCIQDQLRQSWNPYMDDRMDSTETEKEGIQLFVDLSKLWKTAGMHARKWISNSTKVLEQTPCKDRPGGVDILCSVVATK